MDNETINKLKELLGELRKLNENLADARLTAADITNEIDKLI